MDELIDEHDEPADEPHKPTELTDIYCLSCNQRRLKALFDGRFMCYYVGIRRKGVQGGNGIRERHIKLLAKSLLYTYKYSKDSLESSIYRQE